MNSLKNATGIAIDVVELKGLMFGLVFWVISVGLNVSNNITLLGIGNSLFEIGFQFIVNLIFGYLLVFFYRKFATK
jgi:hypothetical protein